MEKSPSSGETSNLSVYAGYSISKDRYTPSTISERNRDLSSATNPNIEQLGDTIVEPSDNLSKEEREILERELYTPTINVSYRMLFRYASKTDLLIFTISTICAMASGAAMPLMAVHTEPPTQIHH
jgi:hypothetical protein